MTPVLACRDLSKRYGERDAVVDVSFEVVPGEVYGFLGPNGAGKTTTISMICGLFDADTGTITVDDRLMSRRAVKVRAALGYVPQEIALYPDLSARENLRFFGHLYGLNGKVLSQRIDAALSFVGLVERADDRIATFSGGMQRRANIAAALLHEPPVLVLDEPTVGVDPQSRSAILEGIRQLADDGAAVVFATHYMEEVERICDRVGIIDGGRLIAEGTVEELVSSIKANSRVLVTPGDDGERLVPELEHLVGASEVALSGGQIQFVTRDPWPALLQLFEIVERLGASVVDVQIAAPDLEAVFLNLTGKALRD
jgi:ABC-2 type transport system ATP-binding protein